MSDFIKKYLKEIEVICQKEDISYLALFGSQARGEAELDSDVDLLVDFKDTPGLIRFISIEQQFEKTFGKKVDLVTRDSMRKDLVPFIEKDLEVIYEQIS